MLKRNTLIYAATVAALGNFASGLAGAQDVMQAVPEHCRVKFENSLHPGVIDLSCSSRVSYKALDLSTSEGVKGLETRVNDAAKIVCSEIGRLYPQSWPGTDECAASAAKRAMAKVNAAVAAAGRKSGS